MRKALVRIGAGASALVLAACSQTVSGHGGQSGAASSHGSSGPTGFPATPTGSPAGGSNAALSGAELAQAAKQAMQSATAFRMTGAAKDAGLPLSFDIHYGETSSDGSMTFNGLTVQLRYVQPDMYMKAGEQFWREVGGIGTTPSARDRATLNLLRDKWVHLRKDTKGVGELAKLAIRSEFVQQIKLSGGSYSKGPSKTINGVAAVSFVDATDGSTVYVPAQGTPYPIRIENPSTSDGGSFELSDWNVPFSAPAPPAGQVVELPG
jgi:hypothetical protein